MKPIHESISWLLIFSDWFIKWQHMQLNKVNQFPIGVENRITKKCSRERGPYHSLDACQEINSWQIINVKFGETTQLKSGGPFFLLWFEFNQHFSNIGQSHNPKTTRKQFDMHHQFVKNFKIKISKLQSSRNQRKKSYKKWNHMIWFSSQ